MDTKMISTTFNMDGYKVIEGLGLVRGLTVRSRNMFSDIGAGVRSMVGGKVGAYVTLCEQTRQEALDAMIENAVKMGADAVIGVRYESNDIAPGTTEVLVYGTAVRVEKLVD